MHRVDLCQTELDFLRRLLLDAQRRLAQGAAATDDDALVAGLELALAMLRWDGEPPPAAETQLGLGAAIQLKLGPDAMCAYRQWRSEQRKAAALAG